MKRETYAEFLERRSTYSDQQIIKEEFQAEEQARSAHPRFSILLAICHFGLAVLIWIIALFAILFIVESAKGQMMPTAPRAMPIGFNQTKPVKKERRLDWKFLSLAGADAGVMIWDITQTQGCLHNVPGCAESNALYGIHPSAARMYALGFLFDGGFFLASYELRHHGPKPLRKLWPAGPSYVIGCHLQAIKISSHR